MERGVGNCQGGRLFRMNQGMQLGDMEVGGQPPAKLVKALATIASGLHPAFDALPWIAPGKSKNSCVLTSLAIREFLFRIGYGDARVVPCLATVRAFLPD